MELHSLSSEYTEKLPKSPSKLVGTLTWILTMNKLLLLTLQLLNCHKNHQIKLMTAITLSCRISTCFSPSSCKNAAWLYFNFKISSLTYHLHTKQWNHQKFMISVSIRGSSIKQDNQLFIIIEIFLEMWYMSGCLIVTVRSWQWLVSYVVGWCCFSGCKDHL